MFQKRNGIITIALILILLSQIGCKQKFADGTYDGNIVSGKRHGHGTMNFSSGNVYVGSWADDKMSGQGTMTYATRDKYAGTWTESKRHGKGILTQATGDQYNGDWLNDEISGQGHMRFSNGDVYEGAWLAAKMNGEGTMVYANGDNFSGKWEAGKKKGCTDLINNVLTSVPELSEDVVDGDATASPGKTKETYHFAIKGKVRTHLTRGKYCAFCVKTIRLAPDTRVPLWTFQNVGEIPNNGSGYKVDHIELNNFAIEGLIKPEENDLLVAGKRGALLIKNKSGFILTEGSAYILRNSNKKNADLSMKNNNK